MAKELLQSINIHLSKVIFLKNAFSGEAVTAGVQICTENERRPVAKPGGYYLFLNMEQKEFKISIQSPIYQPRQVYLKADGGEAVEEILLYPTLAYPVKPGSTVVRGKADPLARLRFHLEIEEERGRLLGDYQKGEPKIAVFMQGKAKKHGRMWFVRDKDKGSGEYFEIGAAEDDTGTYELKEPLQADYRKKQAMLYQAWECPADENGQYCLILDKLGEQDYRLYYSYLESGQELYKESVIQGKKWNTITES